MGLSVDLEFISIVGSSTRRKKAKSGGSIKFDSSEEREEGDEPFVGLGLVHNSLPRNSSKAQLLESDSDSVDDDFKMVPVYASNPHVKIPANVPVPVPRTSLATKKTNENEATDEGMKENRSLDRDSTENLRFDAGASAADCDNNCDSDSTIDIRIRDNKKAEMTTGFFGYDT